ncbi:Alpha/Beta hydrolase protein [Aspergillus bertholletiae]|uniref:Alpha/Beta hydrolase protein n=1 Tax=Aspergillus bertholletiae TaxID=1226010 RepID=A0A5N7AQC3_9EURO|nr:Alpha/Beta hydrolase protein [Aspergillus bertholletiae]
MKLQSLLPLAALLAPSAALFGINDFDCQLTDEHPNPVVLLHGLGATYYEDLNFLQYWLQSQGYCTYAQTYGAYEGFSLLGGLRSISDSSAEIAAFVREVVKRTGAKKVDLVGHSEGAFQSLYVPKFQGVSDLLDKIVAIAPPTHGTNFGGLYNLAYLFGNVSREVVGEVLTKFGCPACDELGPDGAAVERLNDGQPIVQPGNSLTVIVSKGDEMVTPHSTSWVQEDGVNNIYVQDFCPLDPVGHIGEAYDLNVWNLVKNALDGTPQRKFFCVIGSPGKI